MQRQTTRFFYRLERIDGYEYVVVELESSGFRGTGAVLPLRRNGENYKIFMGVIEEYRSLLEKACPEDAFQLPAKLNAHFPGHPKVIFALQSALLSVFCSKYDIHVSKILGGTETPTSERTSHVLIPEYVGDVMRVKYSSALQQNHEQVTFVHTKYPRGEMDDVLSALSTNFKFVEVRSWRELL